MKVVYIAGPYSRGDTGGNVGIAVRMMVRMMKDGLAPICPHLDILTYIVEKLPYETFLEVDLAILEKCDAIFRLPGESPGADREMVRALELGLGVFWDYDELIEWSRQ